MSFSRLLPSALFAFGVSLPASAQVVLFDNLGRSNDGSTAFNELDWRLASDFRTDGTVWTLTSITALMGNTSGNVTHHVTFSIFADNGSGKPGALIADFNTPAELPPNTGAGGLFTATSTGIALQPNSNYWLVGQQNAPESLETVSWMFTQSPLTDGGPFATVTGTPMQSTPLGGGLWVDGGIGNQMFRLEGFSPVPEPETWAALAVMAGGFLVLRGRGPLRRRQG